MKALCVFGMHNYGDPARGLGYESANFVPGLRRLGWDVQHVESWDRSRYVDFAELNVALLDAVRRERPDLVFCVLMGYEIWTETLDLIRACSRAPLVNWGTDDSWKYAQFSRHVAPHVDLWASTSAAAIAAASRDGLKNFVPTQWAANRDALSEPLPASECRYAVSFVGSAYGNRRRWVSALRSRGIDVACFGHGWPAGPVAAADIPRIYRESVVTLNFGDSGFHLEGLKLYRSRQIKARVFEVPGAGGCLLTESADGLEHYYEPGTEIAVFGDADGLARLVRHYLDHPQERDAMARQGHARTRREHTYDERFAHLLETTRHIGADRVDAPDFEWSAALAKLERLSALHRNRRALPLLRWALTTPMKLVWGPRRGPRAARRVLYELSWRMAGARTYGALGWPGRLFYRES